MTNSINTGLTIQGYPLKKRKQVGANRYISPDNHKKLVSHIYNLLASASGARSKRIRAMESTEMDLLGVAEPVGSDCDRAQKRTEGRGAALPDRIYPFGYLKLQRYSAELATIVMPYEAPYTTVAQVDKQDQADAIARALRHSAGIFDHRNNVHACIFDSLALDIFAARVEWSTYGFANSVNQITAGASISEITGPKITHLDPYNISFDASIPVHEVPEHGEFFAEFYLTSKFQIKRMREKGDAYFTQEEFDLIVARNYIDVEQENEISPGTPGYYYNARINEGRQQARREGAKGQQTNFTGLFGHQHYTIEGDYVAKGVHTTRMLIRLSPKEYGLDNAIAGDTMQVYDITLAGDGLILKAEPLRDTGGRFNIAMGTMSFDREFGRHMSHGDAIADMSAFMSSIFNMYKRSKRKGLEGGVTIYNPNVIPLQELDDMHGGRLPIKQMRFDDDLRKHVMQLSDVPDTKNDLRDAEAVLGFLERLLPTNSQPELAGLDRATEFQAQAVAMTGDRELMYHAVIVDGQLMTPLRWIMQYYIMNEADSMTYIDERTRQALTLTTQDIQGTQFLLTQPSTLIGIDRLRVTNLLRDMINMLLQAGDQMPPLASVLMKHFIDLAGMPIDLTEYQQVAQQQLAQQEEARQAETAAMQAQSQQGTDTQGDI